jgi:hypothetical protein
MDGGIRERWPSTTSGFAHGYSEGDRQRGKSSITPFLVKIRIDEVIFQVTHTNDLTTLALTHSALHNLAIPHIYSRFDIVWPDATSTSDTRTGVDALTYGLATLVKAPDVFETCSGSTTCVATSNGQSFVCRKCGTRNSCPGKLSGQRRLGNNYPQFTRKFSLGNGPADWVQEYLITKESGKMLGTLVALAVARMVNLETFIWDMPTGVLRDVWLALASLQDKSPPGECRLERLLVRWHDNSADSSQSSPNANANLTPTTHNAAGTTLTSVGILIPAGATSSSPGHPGMVTGSNGSAQNRVESPTFSVLPPLRALAVLDIDELAYLDEMSVLIAKSKDRLRELRIGISKKAVTRDFVLAWDGPGLQQVDHSATWPGAPSTIGEKRLGGVLGILLGRVFDIRKKPKLSIRSKRVNSIPKPLQNDDAQEESEVSDQLGHITQLVSEESPSVEGGTSTAHPEDELTANMTLHHGLVLASTILSDAGGGDFVVDTFHAIDVPVSATITSPGIEFVQPQPSPSASIAPAKALITTEDRNIPQSPSIESSLGDREHLDGKLKIRVLELERVPLSIAVLHKAFDWSLITSLTILDCAYHESLWKMLKKHFQPQICPRSALAATSFVRHSISANSTSKAVPNVPMEYQLNLKKIHTDFATPALIQFLKETLAPNTLEVLFLQDRRKNTPPPVSINDIYRGPLKRHRRSLKKLLIDSSDRIPKGPSTSTDSGRWRNWMLNHEVLAFLTSGNMASLRELSVAIDYKDWVSYSTPKIIERSQAKSS